MRITLKKQVEDGFIKHVFNLNEDGVLRKQMIHKLIHLVKLPDLEIHKREMFLDQSSYVLCGF